MQNAAPQIRTVPFTTIFGHDQDQTKSWFLAEEALKNTSDLIQLSDSNENDEADDSSTMEQRSPSVSSVNSESPTPTNSGEVHRWDPQSDHWQRSLLSDEHRQLLGTEEESSDKHTDGSNSPSSTDSSSDDDDSNASSPAEEETLESVYAIRPDQRAYYMERFKQLQPGGSALLPGPKAKEFFAKSKLPVADLSKIWELSDVTRDGALSVAEFLVAMHLVVLRRNNVPIPDILPPCLNIPVSLSVPAVQESKPLEIVLIPGLEAVSLPAPLPAPPLAPAEEVLPNKPRESPKNEWTKFVESPTSDSISSPGPKPVNFDFHKIAIDQDPRIIHPIPRRLTPEMQLESSQKISHRPGLRQPSASFAIGDDSHGPTSLPFSSRKDPPPPPPPRPTKGHARSASLDLNSLGNISKGTPSLGSSTRPLVPPRVSPSLASSRGKNQRSAENDRAHSTSFNTASDGPCLPSDIPVHAGAFEVYRKLDVTDGTAKSQPNTVSSQLPKSQEARKQRSSLGAIIDQHRTRSDALRKQHRDLIGDLASLMEEKSILEVRFSNPPNQ